MTTVSPKRRQNTSKICLPNETENNNTSSQKLLDNCYVFGLLL